METHTAFLASTIEHCLSEDDLETARAIKIDNGIPVFFLANGQPVDIVTGQLQPRDTPRAEQICYFNFNMNAAAFIARATNTIPVFQVQ